ncbi:hypothetical protein [Aquimarina sp. 2201CG5-10]|uniref:hypothetical protein n=1 Tax=Aquimarina callyspongiae TaxID=3098150 RepID=UPI002AB558A4|nr:hypothetical protein [Aquimarina sp. 2201CG5-10]MDY8136942.1 hypothetical protein [Aquimarina sp. 2201CG5-10]
MKTYKPSLLYLIKIFGLLVFASFSVLIFNLFFDVIGYFLKSSLFELIILIVVIILFVITSYFSILSNNPIIKFSDTHIIASNQEIAYDQIRDFFPSKGGSEPYIITSEGIRVDLQLSWFRKKDRIEIEDTLLKKIESSQTPS